jgi:hypothetical protein
MAGEQGANEQPVAGVPPAAPPDRSEPVEPLVDLWDSTDAAAEPATQRRGWRKHRRRDRGATWVDPDEVATPAPRAADWSWSADPGPFPTADPGLPDDFGDEAARVRPYAWTRGRTRASYDLKVETLVSTSELGCEEALLTQVEYRTVGTLCRHPHSVAEVAAKLAIPLGVARVLLSDMADLGLISIHRSFADDDIAAHLTLMERVLSGLRRL